MLIEEVIARENGVLYLTCRSSLIPLYTRFGFKPLSYSDLPPYYRRLFRIFRLFQRIVHLPENLAIMRRDAEKRSEV